MTLKEYKNLNENDQYKILWEEGILIDACIEGETKKILYALDNFYIELWCDIMSNKIIWKLSFKQGKLLEKYLDKYSIRNINNSQDI